MDTKKLCFDDLKVLLNQYSEQYMYSWKKEGQFGYFLNTIDSIYSLLNYKKQAKLIKQEKHFELVSFFQELNIEKEGPIELYNQIEKHFLNNDNTTKL